MNDTIAVISTALGVGAISIIRISGPEAISIVNNLFHEKELNKVASHTIHYGHIYDKDEIIDEVLVSVMKAPKTFTTEDVVEINAHGGIATTKRILELLLTGGARLAEPGEFTKRAFLNGRIDLQQAEGIMDLIESKTEASRKLAVNQLSGKMSNRIRNFRQLLIEVLANIEVNIDYPEYEDIEEMTEEILLPKLETLLTDMNQLLVESENGTLIKTGIKTAIIGKPNVGKSSILNAFLEQEKAIVTDIAGTTRDIVEGTIQLDGILLNMIDTAGIRKTDDLVEQIGVLKSKSILKEADLVLLILNGNEEISEEEFELLQEIKEKNYIIVINKNDLLQKLKLEQLDSNRTVFINTITPNGIDPLKEKMIELFHLEQVEMKDPSYLTNARSIALLKQAKQSLSGAYDALKNGTPVDLVEIDIKSTWDILGEIIGETYQDALVEQLFSQFCLGK